jgi:hypothetical protein
LAEALRKKERKVGDWFFDQRTGSVLSIDPVEQARQGIGMPLLCNNFRRSEHLNSALLSGLLFLPE